jgi:hypothetical protein
MLHDIKETQISNKRPYAIWLKYLNFVREESMISVLSNNPMITIILTVSVNVIQQLGQELLRAI